MLGIVFFNIKSNNNLGIKQTWDFIDYGNIEFILAMMNSLIFRKTYVVSKYITSALTWRVGKTDQYGKVHSF